MKTSNALMKAFINAAACVLFTSTICATAAPPACETNIQSVCFTPGTKCEYLITRAIDSAKTELFIQAYHITNHEIIKRILNAKSRGVIVELIVDKAAKHEIRPFINASIPVWVDYKPKIAHNKVMIINREIIITGSFNFTQNAIKNAENVLIFKDVQVANGYRDNFNYRLTQSEEAK
jgi:phospholipase D